MNPRIRELMVELKKTVSTHRGAEVLIGHDELEKFAELIVRECMELSDKALQDGKWPGDVLKEHFGVEE